MASRHQRWMVAGLVTLGAFGMATWLSGAFLLPRLLGSPDTRWSVAFVVGTAAAGFAGLWGQTFATEASGQGADVTTTVGKETNPPVNARDAARLVTSVSGLEVLHRPPDLVPSEFLDRHDVVDELIHLLTDPSRRFVALTGEPGIGKTAVVNKLLERLESSWPQPPIRLFDYISACGNRAVNVPTFIDVLASANPHDDSRERLLERLHRPELSWWAKLDLVCRELNNARVLIAIDDFNRLLTDRGEIEDRSLRVFLEYLAAHEGHGVQLLFVSSVRPRFRVTGFDSAESLRIPVGLRPDEGVMFLRSLVPPNVTGTWLSRLAQLAEGRPRTLELISGVLAASNGDVTGLLQTMARVPGDRLAAALLDRIVGMLTEPDAWVLRGLAIFGRPVPAAGVSELLDRDCDAALARLSGLRLARTEYDTGPAEPAYYLPPDEAEYLIQGMPIGEAADRTRTPRPLTRIALCHHAAAYFRQLASQNGAQRVEDLGPHFGAIRLLIEAGEQGEAYTLINEVEDRYLERWGHQGALSSYRERVEGHLRDANDEVDNLTRMAYALSLQEEHDEALEVMERARIWNADVWNAESLAAKIDYSWNELVMTLEIAGIFYDAGRVTTAAALYGRALQEPFRSMSRVSAAKARSGIGLCQTDTGKLGEAIRSFRDGLELIKSGGDEETSLLRCELMLNLGVAELYRDEDGDDALGTLETARRLARDLQNQVLAARIMDVMAQATIREHPGRALELAQQATAVAAETGGRELAREANVTLALIHLRLGNDEDALAAANVAVEFWRARRTFAGLALQGIARLRQQQLGPAATAFDLAHDRAAELIRLEDEAYQLHEYNGLALAGLAVCRGEYRLIEQAVSAYRRARQLTRARGAISLSLDKLNALLKSTDDPDYARIVAAAQGRERCA